MPRKQLKPPIKLRKKFAPLVALCRERILTAPPQTTGTDNGDRAISVIVVWKLDEQGYPDMPKDFPTGVVTERLEGCWKVRHNVVTLLKYFKAKGYCTYAAADLFSLRLPVLMRLCKMELKLDRMLEGVDIPEDSCLQQDKLDSSQD